MTTGIYTTKWFLQCFIDRVRTLWAAFCSATRACQIYLGFLLANCGKKSPNFKILVVIYKAEYYAYSHKAENSTMEKLRS